MSDIDMPKIQCPFVREATSGGRRYVVTPEVTNGFNWVFEHPGVVALEKLDGTNVLVEVDHGRIDAVWNRLNWIDPWTGDPHICAAIRNSIRRVPRRTGMYYGEAIGPKINRNRHGLDVPEWVPFQSYAMRKLRYTSWGEYPKDFGTISEWFRVDLFSLFHAHRHEGAHVPPEGIVFYHPDGRMAKLRRDMFSWYEGRGHNG